MAGEHVELPELPVELIQHIQSFLLEEEDADRPSVLSNLWYSAWSSNPKEVARTSVLSKLWYSAWSTHPILSLDYRNFASTETCLTEFKNFARRSINRYQKLNTFKLSMTTYRRHDDDYDEFIRLVDELISSALNLGANDLYVRFSHYTSLPHQVFSSIYLKKLHVFGGKIDLPPSNGKPRVVCSQLVSLQLSRVRLSDDMMRDILLGCPLMEDLRVENCDDLTKINLSAVRCSLRNFIGGTILVEWAENNAPGLQNQYHNLISLQLSRVKVDDLFFELFPHRFPCLERLELAHCSGPVMINIDIKSNSLRYLSLIWIDGLNFAKVQALNIQNFRFETSWNAEAVPSLSFLTASEEWKSNLRFYQPSGKDRAFQFSRLLKIRDILTELRSSKISIDIYLSSGDQLGSVLEEIIQSNHISPFVEKLKLDSWISHQNSFGWLLCCRPKYITWNGSFMNGNSNEVLALVYYELKKHENNNLTDALPCIHGLDEVDIEHYDKTLREWRPIRQGDEEAADGGGEFRLRLKWLDQKAT